MLLNVGPKPNGELAIEQENRLREIGLWMFVNSEAIYSVRPWIVTNEALTESTHTEIHQDDRVWFTQKRDNGPLYAFIDLNNAWERGTWREFTLHSVHSTSKTTISVLGQDDQTVEYKPTIVPKSTFVQERDGLHIRVMRAQRLQDDSRWPNALVVKLTNVEPALIPPRISTVAPTITPNRQVIFNGELLDMGDASSLQVAFEYRSIAGEDVQARSTPWIRTSTETMNSRGLFSLPVRDVPAGTFEVHAIVIHPLLTLYGADKVVSPKPK
jgi:alpha-L-fucosidase